MPQPRANSLPTISFNPVARACGYEALAITDECSLAGIVRGLEAARATGLKLIVGSEFILLSLIHISEPTRPY